jgi:hypothetical protein
MTEQTTDREYLDGLNEWAAARRQPAPSLRGLQSGLEDRVSDYRPAEDIAQAMEFYEEVRKREGYSIVMEHSRFTGKWHVRVSGGLDGGCVGLKVKEILSTAIVAAIREAVEGAEE